MSATAFVRARIDQSLKEEAAAVLAQMGLTIPDFVRIGLTKVRMKRRCHSRCASPMH